MRVRCSRLGCCCAKRLDAQRPFRLSRRGNDAWPQRGETRVRFSDRSGALRKIFTRMAAILFERPPPSPVFLVFGAGHGPRSKGQMPRCLRLVRRQINLRSKAKGECADERANQCPINYMRPFTVGSGTFASPPNSSASVAAR